MLERTGTVLFSIAIACNTPCEAEIDQCGYVRNEEASMEAGGISRRKGLNTAT
ncbi:hypothetical protein LINGRAHAP2_LOCUS23881, partial [Linum grandiflorum]